MGQSEGELSTTTFDIYLRLVKAKEPLGPRDLMRAMNISSPGVAHRHLQKLADLGWIKKDPYGRYAVKKKVCFRGYVWVGRYLCPRSFLFAFAFLSLTALWIIILGIHLWMGSPIDNSYSILTVVTVIAAFSFIVESFRPRKRLPV